MFSNRKDGRRGSQALPMGVVIRGAISVLKQKGWELRVTAQLVGVVSHKLYQCSQPERTGICESSQVSIIFRRLGFLIV